MAQAPGRPLATAVAPFTYRRHALDVHFGRGTAVDAVGRWVEAHGARRVLLVASASQASTADDVAAALGPRVRARFTDVVEHVPAATAATAVQLAGEVEADLLLSIGGGSTTGTAKAVALRTGLPVLAVPTTLAGSEVTDTWGLTTDGRKRTGRDVAVLPRAVVYDSALLHSLPQQVAVTSAFNAMAHAVEALWAPRANPLSASVAVDAVRHLALGLRSLEGRRAEALDALQLGSFLAGTAFAEAGSGLHHKICHALGGALDLPHAGTHTVVLPHVLRFNAPVAPVAVGAVAAALGTADAAAGLAELVAATGAPRTLREVGMLAHDLPVAVEAVVEELPVANPRPVTRAAVEQLLQEAFTGEGEVEQP